MLGLVVTDERFLNPHLPTKMKRFLIAASLLLGVALAAPVTAQVSVNINIGVQPGWGPVGYDYVEYYYLPDIDMYYHVPTQEYVYLVNGRWVFSRVLPPYYSGYDFYRGYKVVINDPRPYLYHDRYQRSYAQYRGVRNQPIIRDSRDSRYFGNPGHPQYNQQTYANRNQNQGRDSYSNRNEPDYRQQNNRVESRSNTRPDYRNDNTNRSRNDQNDRGQSRNANNQNQSDRSQSGNRNSRSRN